MNRAEIPLGSILSLFVTKEKRVETINRIAYESLLEEAYNRYPDKTGLDVYDVSWVKVKYYPQGWEYRAAGRVVQMTDSVLSLKRQGTLQIQGGRMTLKRKLFISNILMIVLPLVPIWILAWGIGAALFGIDWMPFDDFKRHDMQDYLTPKMQIAIAGIMTFFGVFVTFTINKLLSREILKDVIDPLSALASGIRHPANRQK
jgi:hypothetical protein